MGGQLARRMLTGAVDKGVKGPLGAATDPALVKPWLKAVGGSMVTETATEMGQSAGEAYVEKQAGVNTDPWEQAKASVLPTLGMTALACTSWPCWPLSQFGASTGYR